ncbi:butyrophilin-like protein 10 isoform X3 [Lates calcarifer]|uniref:Butyrophilin-like protein 10 isoform X3 n=1 Tax=Lates calcarifer TaxID=8187 RepID=A0AAJ7VKE0_LATCA|nr:butyrophilin-like protein 10 isoform X3 [Lates calcarifer]
MFWTAAPLLVFICLLVFTGTTYGHKHGPGVVRVVEGEDAILPCSLSTKEDIVQKLFDWKKDGQKEVFLYDAGIHYNNGRPGQDEQFKGRVSHFQEELKYGNASIIIRNTKIEDRGNYTCAFPRLKPEGKIFNIELIVGAAPPPYLKNLGATEDGVLLQCVVRGAFPKPKVEWQDSDGNVLPAEEPHVSERGGRYDVTLLTNVTKTKTNRFRCVATQENIGHVTDDDIYVPFCESTCGDSAHKWILGIAVGVVLTLVAVGLYLVLYGVPKCITRRFKKGLLQQRNGPPQENRFSAEPLKMSTCDAENERAGPQMNGSYNGPSDPLNEC